MQHRTPRTLLEVRSINKTQQPVGRPQVRLFRDLSFSLAEGERLAVFAATQNETNNLLRCITGIDVPDRGQVERRGSLSWPVGTNNTFSGKLSGYENVRFALEIYSRAGRVKQDMDLVMELSGVDPQRLHDPLGTYPGELKGRLAMAIPLVLDFDGYMIAKVQGADFKAMNPRAQMVLDLFQIQRPDAAILMAGTFLWPLPQLLCEEGIALIDGVIAYRGDMEICRQLALEQRRILQERKRQQVLASPDSLGDDELSMGESDADEWVG